MGKEGKEGKDKDKGAGRSKEKEHEERSASAAQASTSQGYYPPLVGLMPQAMSAGFFPAMYGSVRMSAAENEPEGTLDGTFVASHPYMNYPWGGILPGALSGPAPKKREEEADPPPALHVPGIVLPDSVHMLYDDTAGQPIIAEPRVVEKLKEQGHVVLNLMDAYRTKIGSLQNSINGPVLAKRDALIHNVAKTQHKVEQIKKSKEEAQKLMVKEVEKACKALDEVADKKAKEVVKHLEEVRKQLTKVQEFIMEATAPTQSQDVLRFLRIYPVLCDELRKITTQPAPACPEVDVSDMLEFAAQYANMDDHMAAWKKLVQIKDGMIWQLLDDRKRLETEMEELTQKFDQEMTRMEEENEGYRKKLAEAGLL